MHTRLRNRRAIYQSIPSRLEISATPLRASAVEHGRCHTDHETAMRSGDLCCCRMSLRGNRYQLRGSKSKRCQKEHKADRIGCRPLPRGVSRHLSSKGETYSFRLLLFPHGGARRIVLSRPPPIQAVKLAPAGKGPNPYKGRFYPTSTRPHRDRCCLSGRNADSTGSTMVVALGVRVKDSESVKKGSVREGAAIWIGKEGVNGPDDPRQVHMAPLAASTRARGCHVLLAEAYAATPMLSPRPSSHLPLSHATCLFAGMLASTDFKYAWGSWFSAPSGSHCHMAPRSFRTRST